MRIEIAMVLLLLVLPVLVHSDTCTDLGAQIQLLRTQEAIDTANLQAQISMQGNQTRAYIDARFALDKQDRDGSFVQLQGHIDTKIQAETSPIKQVIPTAITSLAIVCSVLTFLVWRGH